MTESSHDRNFENLENVLNGFREILNLPVDAHRANIDASIQRFKYTYELFWKNLKNFLEKEGQLAPTPKQALILAYQNQWIDDEKLWLSMIDARNLTSHTYRSDLADALYAKLPSFYQAMQQAYTLLSQLKQKYS